MASYVQMAAALVGPICDGGLWRNGRIIKPLLMDNINIKTLDRPYDDEHETSTGPWPRYLVMTASDKGKSAIDVTIRR